MPVRLEHASPNNIPPSGGHFSMTIILRTASLVQCRPRCKARARSGTVPRKSDSSSPCQETFVRDLPLCPKSFERIQASRLRLYHISISLPSAHHIFDRSTPCTSWSTVSPRGASSRRPASTKGTFRCQVHSAVSRQRSRRRGPHCAQSVPQHCWES